MKVDFAAFDGGLVGRSPTTMMTSHAVSETDPLTDVILCPPHHLAPVPCCAVTRGALADGFMTDTDEAARQHEALARALERHGVRCHMLAPSPDLPDMCFTRDVGVSTPWGMVALNPAMPHRWGEASALSRACASWSVPVRRITQGTIEGGDICVAREGLLILGLSGERTSAAGVAEFAAPFGAAGWDVLLCPFDADHLHLDTIFCMVDKNEAIGCLELLDPAFVKALGKHGIRIIAMPSKLSSSLGCNILSLGSRHILASASDAIVATTLREADYSVEQVDISQFAACGGGIHCLTQPLRRVPS
ncbi:dimethylarginine dimethylaminohydrolase family protein [Sphingobium tyrosinilyticum]|uniref:arginine deiminase n=1 Tax=Sphingobium tyrosinilyticum TaxID=2715436 RepID=A0ABV9F163_9SPHN